MKTLALGLWLIPAICSAQVTYDLLLKGGHVIDSKNHVNAVLDVAVAQGKIAAVAAGFQRRRHIRRVGVLPSAPAGTAVGLAG